MAWGNGKPAQAEAVKAFVVYGADEKFDLEASCAKFRAAAIKHVAGQEALDSLIGECMATVFDYHKGANLNTKFIQSQTIGLMAKKVPAMGDPSVYGNLCKRIEEHIHENCNREATEAKGDKPATEAITGKTYAAKLGKHGGFYRVADQSK